MKNYNKFWIVFSLIVVFAAGFIGGILFEKHLIDKKVEKRVKRRSSVRFPSLEMMAQELSLTPEQKDQIREIFKNLRKNIDDRLSSIRSQLKNEIKNVLTDEQVLKFEAMIEKYISQRKKEMEKRKKHPKNHRKDKGEKR
jgi:hypothetical protein